MARLRRSAASLMAARVIPDDDRAHGRRGAWWFALEPTRAHANPGVAPRTSSAAGVAPRWSSLWAERGWRCPRSTRSVCDPGGLWWPRPRQAWTGRPLMDPVSSLARSPASSAVAAGYQRFCRRAWSLLLPGELHGFRAEAADKNAGCAAIAGMRR